MRIAVIGATGRSGRLVAERLRERGHTVVGVVRRATRAAGIPLHELVEADAVDSAALAPGLRGADAVVFCVGPVKGESTTVMRESIAAVLEAMAAVDVRRLVAITATGWIVEGDDPLSRYVAKPLLGLVLREVNLDFAATEALIRASDRDWTIVRPPRLTDGPARGSYRERRDGNVRWGYGIRRADLASAVADVLADPSVLRATVAVSS